MKARFYKQFIGIPISGRFYEVEHGGWKRQEFSSSYSTVGGTIKSICMHPQWIHDSFLKDSQFKYIKENFNA